MSLTQHSSFHGDGTIKFVNGGKYEAAWRFGFAVRVGVAAMNQGPQR